MGLAIFRIKYGTYHLKTATQNDDICLTYMLNNQSSKSLIQHYVTEPFEGYQLVGRYLRNQRGDQCRMMAIHGARSDHRRLDSLLLPLQDFGVGSLSFDLSGHTDCSPLKIGQTSLANNLVEARRFAQSLGSGLHTVFGHSLGGALALKLAEFCGDSIRTLILSCPALYPEAAYDVEHFGSAFTTAISKPYGFLDSNSLPFLSCFKGNVVLIVGEYDGLHAQRHGGVAGRSAGTVDLVRSGKPHRTVYSPIPAEVFAAIREAASSRLSLILLDECDHSVFSHLKQFPHVAQALARYLGRQTSSTEPLGDCRITIGGELLSPIGVCEGGEQHATPFHIAEVEQRVLPLREQRNARPDSAETI